MTDFPYLTIGGVGGSYVEFTEYGERRSYGDAYVWDDIRIPLTQSKLGATSKPDFDYTNIGLLFPQNDATEIAYAIAQLPHSWAEGTTIFPHVHFQQAADAQVTFKIDYKWFNMGDAVPAAFSTATMNSYVHTYVSGNLHQLVGTGSGIAGTGKVISSILLMKLYRQDNVYTGDVLTFELDIHHQRDSDGSATIGAKGF